MKWHRMLVEASEQLLREVLERGAVLDHAAGRMFREHPKWGKRDRHFVAEAVWECVRWRRALAFVADSDDARSLLAAWWSGQGWEPPEGWQWPGATLAEMAARREALPQQSRAVRLSLPNWLDQRGEAELGERWEPEMNALHQRAPVFLRVNRLSVSRAEVLAWLAEEGVAAQAVEGLSEGIVLEGLLPKRLAADPRIEIQDAGSQLVAPLLGALPGERVVDCCAGAGGKTLHLAALMEGQGELLAMDVAERKLAELRRRARLARARCIQTERWQEEALIRRRAWADRILIDAPCSGLGTLRRQPDLKWRLTEPALEKTRRLQRRLLDHYSELLRPGGSWVYATCSILPSENRGQIDALLERDPRWQLAEEISVSPAESGWDGFYAARLIAR